MRYSEENRNIASPTCARQGEKPDAGASFSSPSENQNSARAAVSIYCDGCSIPNPGLTGCGIVIPNVLDLSRFMGRGSNQTAELHAMREALIRARAGDTIFSDSRYAVNLINGVWRAKDHRDLVTEIKRLRRPGVSIVWIPGHKGDRWQERSDRLAKQAVKNRVSIENLLPAGVVDAPVDLNSVVDKCL